MKLYKKGNPVVSIILPTFNRQDFLYRSINSVITQSFPDWELLIVDDGSSDNTYEVATSYMKNSEKIRYLKHTNRKLPLSLNAGIQASAGYYLTFLGSDDEYKKDHIKLRVDYMKKNPTTEMIHGGVEIIGDPYVKDSNDRSKFIHLSNCVIGGTFFGKRDLFFALEGFEDLDYSEDSEFYKRAEKKYKIDKIDFPTYIYYRDTPDSICNTI